MAWCFSTRASVATVLTTHPCVSRCLRVKRPQYYNMLLSYAFRLDHALRHSVDSSLFRYWLVAYLAIIPWTNTDNLLDAYHTWILIHRFSEILFKFKKQNYEHAFESIVWKIAVILISATCFSKGVAPTFTQLMKTKNIFINTFGTF